ncbi:hypothetical protein [Acidovorax sp. Root70]|uniref:hypothetical protein n=1 Tax=Acidovorax sp. Root70 TaxID=1736590 RepID=UPI0006F3EE32|nr:hypothetical protein [Acidovorax sp. Root70]KRB40333.1 hypothetical protein ASD94_17560 [Acidovorax sp. Root70]
MSIFGKAKGAAKYVFVTIPAGVLGVNTLRKNNQTIKALYDTLTNPLCPHCSGGVMRMQGAQEGDNTAMAYTWACTKCDFMLLGGRDKDTVIPTLMAIREEQSLSVFDGLSAQERASVVKSHTLSSRIFLGAAVVFFLGFCWMLLQGSSLLLSINWAALALCMFVLFLKKSYRAWQVENGVLYVKGAFKSWFNNEKWFR